MIFLISTTDIYPSTEVLLDTYGDVYRVWLALTSVTLFYKKKIE